DGLLNILVDYQGQTESVSRSIPIVLNKIKMTMFPEGGDLISGLECRVAFKAENEYGKAADVEGKVYNKSGMPIASFSSYHMGMGAFEFKPVHGDEYYAKITKPEGINEKFELPEPIARGYVLNVDNVNTGQLDVTINSTEVENLSLVAQIRGKMVYAYSVKVGTGSNKIIIPTEDFPIGVAQLTLFDSKGIERAERLVFVNKDKQLNVSIETDKEKYLPREKVKMTISVKDERGMPMPASLSLAVANDQLLSFADDKSGNILSKLLLEPDIAGKVEEPSFYFNKKEAKADKALDYLMMTSGWRRYTWKQVLSNNVPMYSYQGEKAIIGGTIIDYYTGKPIPNADIAIGNTKRKVQTNSKGEFLINNLDLSEAVSLNYSAKDYTAQALPINDYNKNLKLYLYGANYYNAYN
ncbi:MAG: hypothetical protein C0408_10785, partial [Odoribacter sp.]|nr:hypothetical protein [Odoribacter sp.]